MTSYYGCGGDGGNNNAQLLGCSGVILSVCVLVFIQ